VTSPDDSLPLEVDCRSVRAMLDAKTPFLLLDCRETDEHALVRIEGAKLLPLSELANRAEELEPHRDSVIVVYCHHGHRSQRVAEWLRGQSYAGAQSMAGGIERWAIEIDPSLPRY